MVLKLENIPKNASQDDLKQLVSNYGKVKSVARKPHKAFIKMSDPRAAKMVLSELQGKEWKGFKLHVCKSRSTSKTPVCHTKHGVYSLI